jgi:hypothetical protein
LVIGEFGSFDQSILSTGVNMEEKMDTLIASVAALTGLMKSAATTSTGNGTPGTSKTSVVGAFDQGGWWQKGLNGFYHVNSFRRR